MYGLTVSTFHRPDLENILASEERLLWSGQPSYGRRFFQAVGDERVLHFCLIIGAAIMWSTLPFIEPTSKFGREDAVWIYVAVTIAFVAISASSASSRQYVLYNLVFAT